jgi:7,8-dihydroneopterin aldolase/epimerase/oxygenase
MRFYAYHGYYEEEQRIGNNFVVDIYIDTGMTTAAGQKDDLELTINYETVYEVVRFEMKKKQKLLETVSAKILDAIRAQFRGIFQVRLRIRKLNPPLGGMVASSYIETVETYQRKCGSCDDMLVCYANNGKNNINANIKNCWCMDAKEGLHPRTLEMIQGQFKSCICGKCLKKATG